MYQEVKYYLKEEECKRKDAEFIARYDAYRKERDEYFKTHEYVNLTSADDDEFFIGSEFLMREKFK